MKRLINFIETKNSGKITLRFFILTNMVYTYMLMVTIPKTMEFSNGMKLLDMMPTGYNWSYVNGLFDSLGENGIKTYLNTQIPIDMIYPLLFGLSYCLVLAYFLKKLNKLTSPFTYLCLLPIIAGITDYFENFGIIKMLKNYPELNETTVFITNIFSVTKSISTSIFFTILIIVLVILGLKKLRKKQ